MTASLPLTAVILAAGSGERIRNSQQELPKPLVRVGGLPLLERSILTLKAAGILHFRIVLGFRGQEIESTLSLVKTLQGLDLKFIYNEEYEKGNGSSLAAGVRGLNTSFLLTMADHLFGLETLQDFITKSQVKPERPQLATDADIAGVFDLADATKVKSLNSRILAIGKNISDYNEVDTGLFYFPTQVVPQIETYFRAGANSVSEIVAKLDESTGFYTTRLENAFWQDVDTPAMRLEAEKRLYRSLIKPSDGPVSRHFNRYISLWVSRRLVNFNVSPNSTTTFVFLLSIAGAVMASSTEYFWIAWAGVIFQVASILDGCDGEIARITYQGSEFGAWYDTLTDNLRYGVFFCAMGIGGYRSTGSIIYIAATIFFALVLSYLVTINVKFLRRTHAKGTHLVVSAQVEKLSQEKASLWDKFVVPLRVLVKQDVSALFVFFLCLINKPIWMFWGGCIGVSGMTYTVARTFHKLEKNRAQSSH